MLPPAPSPIATTLCILNWSNTVTRFRPILYKILYLQLRKQCFQIFTCIEGNPEFRLSVAGDWPGKDTCKNKHLKKRAKCIKESKYVG